jgi:hypothetical protein
MENMQIPIAWILSTIISLGVTIASLAGIMWSFVKSRIDAQDKIIDAQDKNIEAQNATIRGLQGEVERMAQGCGASGCVWKGR